MATDELLKNKHEQILAAAARRGASNVRVFGSVARGEGRPNSDVDFLVDLERLLDIQEAIERTEQYAQRGQQAF